jgi:hypothetical protein
MILRMAAIMQHTSQIFAVSTSSAWEDGESETKCKLWRLCQALAKQSMQNISQAKPANLVLSGVNAKLNAHRAKLT